MFNRCIFIGHLTHNPELKHVANNQMCRFSIAMNHKTKDKEEVCFVDVTVWGKQAEFVAQYFTKGKEILVEGRLRQENWEKDGKQFSKHTIAGEKISFVGSNSSGSFKEKIDQAFDPVTDELPF